MFIFFWKSAKPLPIGLGMLFCSLQLLYAQETVRYQPDWQSLARHQEVPEWMRDAKFGMYVHWGVYAVPAYNNEHYYHEMHEDGAYSKLGTHKRHVAIYGPLSEFGYHDFIPMFKGAHFNADGWADLFVKGGARFAGLVAEHHDGFAMWDSECTPFDAKEMGPKQDVVGAMEKAIRQQNMKFFASLHHSYHYTNVQVKPEWEAAQPQYAKLYGSPMSREAWLDMWLQKCNEVVDKYHPDIMYFDAWLDDIPETQIQKYLAHYFNDAGARDEEVIVTYKGEDLPEKVGMLDHENSNPDHIIEKAWLSDYSIGTGNVYAWGYTDAMEVRPAKEIIHKIIEVVSKNGQLLLNLSPKADGTIPQNQQEVVHRVGRWLWSFGESIYGTRPFSVYGEKSEGLDVYYTQKDKNVYAIFQGWPGKNTAVLLKELTDDSLPGSVKGVTLLGLKKLKTCTFEMDQQGLTIHIPEVRLPDDVACVFRIETE